MAELTVDYLSILSYDEPSKSNQSKRRPVTSIIEWGQCFTQYTAIVTQAKPERTADLLGYQHLILEAHLEYFGDGWIIYDRRFRQIAATRPGTTWAQRDGDLWNMTFGNSQRRPYCQHCFGSTHTSEQCSGAPDATQKGRPLPSSALRGRPLYGSPDSVVRKKPVFPARPMFTSRSAGPKICWEWNQGHCTFPACQYIHACLLCHGNPHFGNSNHKYANCPRNHSQQQGPPVPPLMGNPSHPWPY